MRSLVDIPAFHFDQLRFDWGDVVLAAVGWGEWQRLGRSCAEELASAGDAEAEQVDSGTVAASVVTFRRSRRLLAGDEYLRWLSERSLAADDVRAHFARSAKRERAAGRLSVPLDTDRTDPAQLAEAMRVAAIVDGRLQAWANRLARCAAAARGLKAMEQELPPAVEDTVEALIQAAAGDPTLGIDEAQATARAPRIAALQAAAESFAATVLTPERLKRCLSDHRNDWQHFVWEELRFAAEGGAREAALLVREDRMELDEVAGLSHARVKVRQAYADGVPDFSGLFAAAVAGEVVGPLVKDGEWVLVRMVARTPPAVDDPILRDRAQTEIVDDALERHLAGRVTWHAKY